MERNGSGVSALVGIDGFVVTGRCPIAPRAVLTERARAVE